MMDAYPQMVVRKRSFLATVAWGISVTVVVVILSVAAIILYGMNIADRKTNTLIGFAEMGVRNLPELCRALPPVVADVVNDERRPDYRDQIEIKARLASVPVREGHCRNQWEGGKTVRPVVEVRNNGKDMVSLLSMRVVVLDDNNVPVAESTEWAATPIALDEDWRGPLMPGAVAYVVCSNGLSDEARASERLRVEVSVTDIRVWNKTAPQAPQSAPPAVRPSGDRRAMPEAVRPSEAPRSLTLSACR